MLVSIPLIYHALTAAVRDKLIWALLATIIVVCSLSIFMGSIAISEQEAFTTVFAASGLRLAVMAGLILFVIFFIRRSADAKDIEFLLSRPITKTQLVMSYTLAFAILTITMWLAIGGLMILASGGQMANAAGMLWLGSVIMEDIMMMGVAMFFALFLNSAATAAMATAGLYVLGRMMGQILGIVDAGADLPGAEILSVIMQAISIVVPRFDLFAQSSWLVYGIEGQVDIMLMVLQTIVFSTLVYTITCLDLTRRQF